MDKKCNKCGIILPFRAFRKKNNNQGWKDIEGNIRYSYCKEG